LYRRQITKEEEKAKRCVRFEPDTKGKLMRGRTHDYRPCTGRSRVSLGGHVNDWGRRNEW
jgi:hypothetical protein